MKRTEAPVVAREALEEQKRYMASVRALLDAPRKYHIVTLGCQMNVRDSESLAGMLDEMGYVPSATREEADLILYNTCCVRENAENKALGNVIWLKELKKVKSGLVICVGGCMTQENGMAERLKAQYPFIDLIFGTHNLYRFPVLLYRVLAERARVAEVLPEGAIVEGLPVQRGSRHQAFLSIMQGCDNFCSYCIVPYVRGRERSRAMEDVLREAKRLIDDGVQEITLLGQNVNSYGGGGRAFSELLYRLDALGVNRIRFMTSHPKDLSDELIAAYGELKHLAPHLHLPVQAGNDRILSLMNRRYTREHYIELVKKLRAVRPDVGLTSDIIVGFPGETAEEFEDTMNLVRLVRFDAAFTFIYSPRVGTKAAAMPDPVRAEEKTERIERLIHLQQDIGREVLSSLVGSVQQVLVDGASQRDDAAVCGKTGRSHMVNFPGNTSLAGSFVDVRITSAGRNTLRGEIENI